jgi:signal transduction histidine kinase
VGLPRFKRAILVLAGLAPIWLALVAFTERYALYRLWMALVLAASVLTVVAMLWRARQGMDSAQRVSLIVSAAILVAGLRDFAVVQLGWRGDGDLRWMIWFSLAFMLTAAWILVDRSQRMVAAQIQLAKDLELRVGERESELRQAFERLRDAEREQVLTNERARITRDMHDGLGSQLVQALNLARAGEAGPERLVDMLQHALEELRTTLDALQPMEGDLPTILGTLRQRIAPALDAAGIQLDWAVLEVPAIRIDESVSESTAMMHLFKLLQEVFANILKHAGASRVRVRTYVRDSGDASTTAPGRRVVLEVMDNGAGLGSWATPRENRAGRGLANMRMRAAAVGAHVSWKPARPGTMVEISFLVRG